MIMIVLQSNASRAKQARSATPPPRAARCVHLAPTATRDRPHAARVHPAARLQGQERLPVHSAPPLPSLSSLVPRSASPVRTIRALEMEGAAPATPTSMDAAMRPLAT